MSLLDSVIGALANSQPGVQPPASGATQGTPGSVLLSTVISMLANGQHPQGAGVGGLGDLIGRFTQGGLGDVIGSWIGNGQNAPISGDQLSKVLGSDAIGQIAAQLGVSQGDAAGQLSQMLPEVISRLTPQGAAPSGGFGDDMGALLGQLMAKR
ncbi:MAG TPA: YidB family protein [Burkholderiaceae bacterium]|nr:YidB family protein [Burkholderiaceae bacterium]